MRLQPLFLAVVSLLTYGAEACTCQGVTNPGLYCGYCLEVESCPHFDRVGCGRHVFQCATNGGCSDLGDSSTHCANHPVGTYCDGRDAW